MNTSESINELAAALAKAQAEMPAAKMNATNPFLKNRYADLTAVTDAARATLAVNGLSYVQMPGIVEGGEFGIMLTTRLMHTSGQWLEDSFFMPMPTDERGKSVMQVAGSAISYARRYALSAMLGIVADEDSDGNAPAKKAQEPQRTEAPRPPITKPTPEPEAKPASAKPAPALQPTKAMFNKLHSLGVQKFGPEWDDARHELIGKLTEGRTQSSKQLTYEEVVKLAEQVKSFADFVEEVDDNTHYDESDADGAWNSMH